MQQGGKILHEIIYQLKKLCIHGVSAMDLEKECVRLIKQSGASPGFLGYQGYPNALIVCRNNEVVHGIPHASKVIQNGDLVTLDLGLSYQGYITDMAISFTIGQAIKQANNLIFATQTALQTAIENIKPGMRTGDLGYLIEQIAVEYKFCVVRDCAGHGVGKSVHESPIIPNFGQRGQGIVFSTGMTLAIEPIFSESTEHTYVLDDDWTLVTDDGSLSAQSEHTIIITETGCEVLT